MYRDGVPGARVGCWYSAAGCPLWAAFHSEVIAGRWISRDDCLCVGMVIGMARFPMWALSWILGGGGQSIVGAVDGGG